VVRGAEKGYVLACLVTRIISSPLLCNINLYSRNERLHETILSSCTLMFFPLLAFTAIVVDDTRVRNRAILPLPLSARFPSISSLCRLVVSSIRSI